MLIEIAETAGDCAALAVVVAKSGDTVVSADATAAAILAAAGADMATHLVEVNLIAGARRSARIGHESSRAPRREPSGRAAVRP